MTTREARFIVAPGEEIRSGDLVCIDPDTGKVRRADGRRDRNAFPVPADAWQEGDRLCIPPTNRTIM